MEHDFETHLANSRVLDPRAIGKDRRTGGRLAHTARFWESQATSLGRCWRCTHKRPELGPTHLHAHAHRCISTRPEGGTLPSGKRLCSVEQSATHINCGKACRARGATSGTLDLDCPGAPLDGKQMSPSHLVARPRVQVAGSVMLLTMTDPHLEVSAIQDPAVGERPEAAGAAALVQARSWWLEYCREVVNPEDRHRLRCIQLGGSQDPAFPSDVRWPGYFGPGYRPGGMMIAANIHSDFDERFGRPWADAAADVVRDWAAGRIDDGQYLQRTAEVYQPGLEAWRVGFSTGRPMRYLNIPWTDIVYVNGARCQTFDTGVKLQQICRQRWPLSVMAEKLRPQSSWCRPRRC